MPQIYPYAIENKSSATIYVRVGESGNFGSGVYASAQRNGNLSYWPIAPEATETWKREDPTGIMISVQTDPKSLHLFADNPTGTYTYKDGRITRTA